jgi:hypothetical protein
LKEFAVTKKRSANKSQLIRDYKAQDPSAGPKEIAEALSKGGLSVTAQFVSTVLAQAKKKAGKAPGKRGRKPRVSMTSGIIGGEGLAAGMTILKAAGDLLKVAGDKSLAKEALDMVAALRN